MGPDPPSDASLASSPGDALLARAFEGDSEALDALADARDLSPRILPGLALARSPSMPAAPAAWTRELRRASARHLALSAHLDAAAEALDAANAAWVPIKGMDLSTRPGVYPAPEARPTADLDLLVRGADLDRARAALEEAGWTPLATGARVECYLREEGYAWQARGPEGGLLELHHRLWGSVGADVGDAMLQSRALDGDRPRLRPEHAFLVAATHAFLDAPPRDLLAWRDLHGLARLDALSPEALADEADRFDLQLPTILGATVARRLFGSVEFFDALIDRLRPSLRPSEARLLRRDAPESTSVTAVVLARALAGRRMRHGLGRLVLRRLWAHPGIVEASGASRLGYQLAAWGLRRPAAASARETSRVTPWEKPA